MKQLSIEEKAKAYDEALTKARNIVNSINVGLIGKDSFEAVFPELKESEDENTDEKVRKALIKLVTNHASMDLFIEYDIHLDEALSWLEKRGKNNMGISESVKQKLEDNLNKALEKETPESWNEFLDEQKPAWSEEDEEMLVNAIFSLNHESVIEGLKSRGISYSINSSTHLMKNLITWLKSLKDRYTWRPNLAQLNALSIVLKGNAPDDIETIQSLYQDLLKLKG